MIHRHLDSSDWSPAAIDSALEHGDLADWRELLGAVAEDARLARDVLAVARAHRVEGASALVIHLVGRLWPNLKYPGTERA